MPTIETMDRGKALDKEQFGLNVEPKYSRQYSSPHTDEIPVDVLEDIALSEADRRLAEMGYIQVYKREFSWVSCFSFAISLTAVFAGVATTFSYPLNAGGAASAVWCWLIAGAGGICIALSVSELVSAYPTSGGLYFTCKYLAPEEWVPEISWICGWLNLLGQIAGVASAEFGAAQLLLAAVSMGSDFSYTPTIGHTIAVMAAVTILHGMINSLRTSVLGKMVKLYVIFHVGVLVSACITLLVMTKDKHDSTYVFTNVFSSSGWRPTGFSFLFGFLSVSWSMTDYDATAHIAEEIKDPAVKAPWAISSAIAFTYVAGWLFTLVLTYCMGDPATILASPIAQPVAQIFYNNTGKSGGIFFTVAMFLVLSFGNIVALQSGSRTIWAYSRDEMLPLSRIWYKINKHSETPLYSVWLFTILCVLINLIGLGSYIAIASIFNLTAIALDWSYCIPIICKLLYGKFRPGPWHLGRASFFINAWAVIWTTFISIIFVLPTVRPVTLENMNYVPVLMVTVTLFVIVYWYAAGRHFYIGPRVKVQLVEVTNYTSSGNFTGEEKKKVY